MSTRSNTLLLSQILLLIFLPLLDTFSPGFFGINVISPLFMAKLYFYSLPIKMIMVAFALWLIMSNFEQLKNWFGNTITLFTFVGANALVAIMQLLLLTYLLFVETVYNAHKEIVHQEHQIQQNTFYVRTANSDNEGNVAHFIHLKCAGALQQYQLKYIGKTNWVGHEFVLSMKNNVLTIASAKQNSPVHYELPLEDIGCL